MSGSARDCISTFSSNQEWTHTCTHVHTPFYGGVQKSYLKPGLESQLLLFNPVFSVSQMHPFCTPSAERSILPLVLHSAESSFTQKASCDSALCYLWSTYVLSFPAGCIQNEYPHVWAAGKWTVHVQAQAVSSRLNEIFIYVRYIDW